MLPLVKPATETSRPSEEAGPSNPLLAPLSSSARTLASASGEGIHRRLDTWMCGQPSLSLEELAYFDLPDVETGT